MTDITPYEEPATTQATGASSDLQAWAQAMGDAMTLAKGLAGTDFVPNHFRGKPADTAVAIMKVAALEAIYVISGKPALYTRSMVALTLSAGHQIWTEDASNSTVTVCGRRRGSDHVERSTWDTARAKTAGLDKNQQYARHPEAMLYARAAGDICRRIAPDVLAGLSYSVEELQEDDTPTIIQRKPKTSQETENE